MRVQMRVLIVRVTCRSVVAILEPEKKFSTMMIRDMMITENGDNYLPSFTTFSSSDARSNAYTIITHWVIGLIGAPEERRFPFKLKAS